MDKRSARQKWMDDHIGPPLYFSSECMLPVEVKEDGIVRPCGDCNCQVLAPRKAVAVGKGGMNLKTKAKVSAMQIAASITGRCV